MPPAGADVDLWREEMGNCLGMILVGLLAGWMDVKSALAFH